MALQRYRNKRDFSRTPEPRGARAPDGAPSFVVHKHDARRLHYDLRLQVDGVLKSWAVPKGLSLDPKEKRLAIMVEDHPLQYRDFEGVIPKGNYGAGTVIIWDEGAYTVPGAGAHAQDAVRKGLRDGKLEFVLAGEKLRGTFVLAKMRGGEENAWLLIKKADEFAQETDITEEPRSVRSGKTNEELRSGPEAGTDPMPDISPMLATLAEEPFDRWGWLFELKWDGYRAIARVEEGAVHLRSRSGISFDEEFAPIRDALRGLRHTAVIDGEVVALDEEGRARFSLLQRYRRTGAGTLAYYAFDLLYLDGHSLLEVPLRQRKELLKELLRTVNDPAIRFSSHVEHDGRKLFEKAREQGLEGIVGKNGESRYAPGRRSREWMKIKTHMRQEAVIGGFTQPRGSRKHIGALILGVYEGDRLVPIGHADGKMTDEDLPVLRKKLEPLITQECPFGEEPQANMPATWVRPELVCEVEFSEWTPEGRMRHPVYVGLREDRGPQEVVRERPEQERGVRLLDRASDRTALMVGCHEVALTNLRKTYWPEEGITKGDLIDYYRAIEPVLMPYLMDRPENLHRFPNGIADEGFFEKDVSKEALPSWVKTAGIYSESNEAELKYLVCDSAETLLYMVNLGCIELNPWNARVGSLERPDYIVIDLDPVEVPFCAVAQTARAVKSVLDDLDIPGFPKTSGATGIHIYVSLGARYPWEQARQLSELIAALTHERLPDLTSLERSPRKRRGKVYLDFLQNRRGQTLAAPYCVRPLPGAPVSTPLAWEEVNDDLDPARFTIHTIFDRLRRTGDLWRDMLSGSINIADVVWLLGK